jgi:hypothetical protein
MSDNISYFLGVSPPTPPPTQPPTEIPVPSDLPSKLIARYADAYTEAHAAVAVGQVVKFVGVILFIVILIAGLLMARGHSEFGQIEMNGAIGGMGFTLACLVGIPTFILGILVAAQGQTQLATLDTAVNSSRHLKDDDVAKILSRRFSL